MIRHTLHDWLWRPDTPGASWSPVELPHTAVVADPDGHGHWLGASVYRRQLQVMDPVAGERHAVFFGAAMQTAEIWLDGRRVTTHRGGYLPFQVDLTEVLEDGREHELEVRLDHRDDPDIPPGKPHAELDFCRYGGLYREAELRRFPAVHITEAVAGNEAMGGGILAITQEATAERALVAVSIHVANGTATDCRLHVVSRLVDPAGQVAAEARAPLTLAIDSHGWVQTNLTLPRPQLWSIASPSLYRLVVELRSLDGALLDQRSFAYGVRTVTFSRSQGMLLNGEPTRARGVNRHQDHPWAGYALPRAAQRREARRIKGAGFDYVRLSHYPQSPHFLEACDELGIVVMTCLPGWQFFGGAVFQQHCEQSVRTMIRRDRNHACIVLWELSLNETPMDEAFAARLRQIAVEEYPGGHLVTCGWLDFYDVYLRSRQHGLLHTWRSGDKALVVAEYGDWEYYATNEGFDQGAQHGLLDAATNSRVLRGDGEARLRRQATNHAEALRDVLACGAPLSGLWSMVDYPRGYNAQRASCGVMDAFRLPKFSYHFYRSQRTLDQAGPGWGGPMVFIASWWTPASSLDITVFSNTQTVELRLNGQTVGRHTVDVCPQTGFRAPVHFPLERFVPGLLEAWGWQDGVVVAKHTVATPGAPASLHLWIDDTGETPGDAEPDLLFAHVEVHDAQGQLCPEVSGPIELTIVGEAQLVGPALVELEAGVASFLIRRPIGGGDFGLHAFGVRRSAALWIGAERGTPNQYASSTFT